MRTPGTIVHVVACLEQARPSRLIAVESLAVLVVFAVLTALVVGPLFVFLRWLGLRAERAPDPVANRVHRIGRAMVVTRLLLFPIRYLLAIVPLLGFLGTPHGGWHAGAVVLLIVLIIGGAVLFWIPQWAVRRALAPSLARLRGLEPIRPTPRRMLVLIAARAVMIGIYVLLVLFFGGAAHVFGGHGLVDTVARLAALVVVLLLTHTLFGWVRLWEWRARPLPAGANRDRWMALADRMGVRIRDIRLIPAGPTKTANAMQLGVIPGLRYVAVTDYMITNMDDRQCDAVLAHEFGHARGRHILISAFCPTLLWAIVRVPLVGKVSTVEMIALWFVIVLLFRAMIAVHLECRADDAAAREIGAVHLADALTRIAELNHVPHATGPGWSLLTRHPGIGKRIRRINGGHSPSPATGSTDLVAQAHQGKTFGVDGENSVGAGQDRGGHQR
jgi:STE24 endopeptidase